MSKYNIPKNTSLAIVKGSKRFSVTTNYNSELIRFFNTIDKRFYDYETQRWSFPIEILQDFVKFMEENQITYSKTDSKNFANINVKKDVIELTFQSYISQFGDFLSIPGATYLRSEKKFLLPLDKEQELCEQLMKHNFSIFRNGEMKQDNELIIHASEEEEEPSTSQDLEPSTSEEKTVLNRSKKHLEPIQCQKKKKATKRLEKYLFH
jgi:hypothetical protein